MFRFVGKRAPGKNVSCSATWLCGGVWPKRQSMVAVVEQSEGLEREGKARVPR